MWLQLLRRRIIRFGVCHGWVWCGVCALHTAVSLALRHSSFALSGVLEAMIAFLTVIMLCFVLWKLQYLQG